MLPWQRPNAVQLLFVPLLFYSTVCGSKSHLCRKPCQCDINLWLLYILFTPFSLPLGLCFHAKGSTWWAVSKWFRWSSLCTESSSFYSQLFEVNKVDPAPDWGLVCCFSCSFSIFSFLFSACSCLVKITHSRFRETCATDQEQCVKKVRKAVTAGLTHVMARKLSSNICLLKESGKAGITMYTGIQQYDRPRSWGTWVFLKASLHWGPAKTVSKCFLFSFTHQQEQDSSRGLFIIRLKRYCWVWMKMKSTGLRIHTHEDT